MIRAALGMIGIGVMIHAWGSYRFDRELPLFSFTTVYLPLFGLTGILAPSERCTV